MEREPTVVFLHGMGQDERSNEKLRRAVRQAGYRVWCTSYPTRQTTISALAQEVGDRIEAELGREKLFAVAHSLGAILVRHFAERFDWQRVVMLGPPNQGARIAQRLRGRAVCRWAFGPVLEELADASRWPEPPKPFAVIAGTRSLTLGNPTSWLSQAVGIFDPGQHNDGTIALDETRHPEMADFAVLDASHTGLLDHPFTARLVLEFLADGVFRSRLPQTVAA